MTGPVLPAINTPVAGLPGQQSLKMDPIWYRYFAAKDQESVNTSQIMDFVNDFGAVGDGSTDNATQMTNAVAWLNGGSQRTMEIPPGTYRVSGGPYILTQNYTSIVGESYTNCRFVCDDTTFLIRRPTSPDTNTVFGGSFENLSFSCVTDNPQSSTYIRVVKSSNFRILYPFMINTYIGIALAGAGDTIIEGAHIQSAGSWLVPQPNSALILLQSYITALNVPNTNFDTIIHGFNIEKSGGAGAPFNLGSCLQVQTCDNCVVSDGIFAFGNQSVRLNPVGRNDINILDFRMDNVYIDGGTGQAVSGHRCIDIEGTAGSGVSRVHFNNIKWAGAELGVNVNYAADNVSFINCSCNDNGSLGDLTVASVDGLVVEGCQFAVVPSLGVNSNVRYEGNTQQSQAGAGNSNENVFEISKQYSLGAPGAHTQNTVVITTLAFNGGYVEIVVTGVTGGVASGCVRYRGQLASGGAAVTESTIENLRFPTTAGFATLTVSISGLVATYVLSDTSVGIGSTFTVTARVVGYGISDVTMT